MPKKRPYQDMRTYVKDCSGKEIYEGAEVEFLHIPSLKCTGPHKVIFENGSFGVLVKHFFPFSEMDFSGVTVRIVPKEGD